MLCYRDKTWCPYQDCSQFDTCPDSLTTAVKENAERWWGRSDKPVPIAVRSNPPNCFVIIHEGNQYDYRSALHNGLIGPGKQLKNIIAAN